MKKAILLLITLTFILSSCQATPEDLIVQNKNDGELEAAINATAVPQEVQDVQETKQEIRIIDSLSNDLGTVTVNIDAIVKPKDDRKVTITRMEPYYLSEPEMDRICRIFFGQDLTYYDRLSTTKADIEENIIYLQHRLTLDDNQLLEMYADKELYDVSEIKNHINNVIDELKEKAAKASEAGEVLEKFESRTQEWGGFYANVDYGGQVMGGVSYSEPLTGRVSFSCSMDRRTSNQSSAGYTIKYEVDKDSDEYTAAKQTAQILITVIGIEGVELDDVYIVQENSGTSASDTTSGFREYFVFCFERTIGERTLDHTFYRGGYSDDNEVMKSVPYEKITVTTEGAALHAFAWNNPHRMLETVNDNAAVQVDYEQALELAKNNIFQKYAYLQEQYQAEKIIANISGIEFEMVRMKEKNTDYYITVPAWKIYGEVLMKRTQEELDNLEKTMENDTHELFDLSEYVSMTKNTGPNILTINALDGSIIDMQKGY